MTENVEVLVRDALQVQKMQLPQRLQVDRRRAGVSDPGEVKIEKAGPIPVMLPQNTPSSVSFAISCFDIPRSSP